MSLRLVHVPRPWCHSFRSHRSRSERCRNLSSTTDRLPKGARARSSSCLRAPLATLLIASRARVRCRRRWYLERRDQQNAADAAALAGARYVNDSRWDDRPPPSPSARLDNARRRGPHARLARSNDFRDVAADEDVLVHIRPLQESIVHRLLRRLRPSADQVTTRDSIFGGIVGRARAGQSGVRAVAANEPDEVAYSFGMLALRPTELRCHPHHG